MHSLSDGFLLTALLNINYYLMSCFRKLEDADGHNRELLGVVNKREEAIRSFQVVHK